jgi:hypothetical protein
MQRLIPVSDENAWRRCLDRSRHTPAHTWDYCLSIAERTGFPVYLYECEDQSGRAICSLLERNYAGHVSVCTLPGFSGLTGEIGREVWLSQFREFANSHRWVCGYIGLHPIFAPAGMRDLPTYRSYNNVYVMDIQDSEDLIKSRMSQNRRRQLGEADKAGLSINKDRAAVARFFKDNFFDFMLSKGVKLTHHELWPTTDRFLSAPNTILLGAGKSPAPIEAASVFGYTPDCADFWYGISKGDGAQFSTGLMWAAVRELRALGVPLLNLGGGIRPGDGVAGFKQRFGAVELELGSLQLVFQPELYSELCGSRKADNGYFPAYHAPAEN